MRSRLPGAPSSRLQSKIPNAQCVLTAGRVRPQSCAPYSLRCFIRECCFRFAGPLSGVVVVLMPRDCAAQQVAKLDQTRPLRVPVRDARERRPHRIRVMLGGGHVKESLQLARVTRRVACVHMHDDSLKCAKPSTDANVEQAVNEFIEAEFGIAVIESDVIELVSVEHQRMELDAELRC